MAVEVSLIRPSPRFDPVSRESWPIGCQLGANRTPIGIRFLELTMEIFPVAISHHRHHAREHYHRQFYSKYQVLFDCNGEFSLKTCGERDNTI